MVQTRSSTSGRLGGDVAAKLAGGDSVRRRAVTGATAANKAAKRLPSADSPASPANKAAKRRPSADSPASPANKATKRQPSADSPASPARKRPAATPADAGPGTDPGPRPGAGPGLGPGPGSGPGPAVGEPAPGKAAETEPEAPCRTPFEPHRQMYVGAHVSGAGGLWKAVREAHDIGARSFALFLASQRTWNRKPLTEQDVDQFRNAMKEYGYSGDLVVPHGSYLMNLGSPDPETRAKSCALLVDELTRCQQLGLPLFNFHPGSTCGKISREESISHIARGVNAALKVTSGVTVLLENMSRQGHTLGGDFSELRAIIDLVDDADRVGVCLDTCHAHAAGYDLATEKGFAAMMGDFESVLGLHRLRAVHLNDSKSQVGSHLDRHENIGKGTIGRAGITRVMADPRFQRLPVVLETPYVNDDIYRREIKLLYDIINK